MSHPDTDKGGQKNIIKNKKAIINVEFKKRHAKNPRRLFCLTRETKYVTDKSDIGLHKKNPSFFSKSFFFGEADAEKKIKKIKLKSYINMQS